MERRLNMSCVSVTEKHIAVVNNLEMTIYDYTDQFLIQVPIATTELKSDHISDVIASSDCKYLALITASSKQLLVYELETRKIYKNFILPRSASKIRFTPNNKNILVADKSGDVLIYDIDGDSMGKKLLGHLSLLLDILQTFDEKFIITSDRDEKIRVSCYPNTYNIQTYCLGHKEFVNHIEILPHNNKYLLSTSGDGFMKLWDYITGKVCYKIDTYLDINDDKLRDEFIKIMDTDGVEVNRLPIVHFAITKMDENKSILAVTIYGLNALLIYSLSNDNNQVNHKLEYKLKTECFPAAIQLHNLCLFIYYHGNYNLSIHKLQQNNGCISIIYEKTIQMFHNSCKQNPIEDKCFDSIKVLYKRKYDNVQEYQERKKQRLEKCT